MLGRSPYLGCVVAVRVPLPEDPLLLGTNTALATPVSLVGTGRRNAVERDQYANTVKTSGSIASIRTGNVTELKSDLVLRSRNLGQG